VILEQLLAVQPDSPSAQLELGLCLAGLGESGAAIAVLRQAQAARQAPRDAWQSLRDQLVLAGDPSAAAIAQAESMEAAALSPRLAEAVRALRENRLHDAATVLERLLRAVPGDVTAIHLLGETAWRLGRLEDAAAVLLHGITLAPGDAELRYTYARVLHDQGRAAEAIVQLAAAFAVMPEMPKGRFLAALCLVLVGEYAAAAALAQTLIHAHPEQPGFHLCHGQALRILGHTEAAITAYRAALRLRPNMGEAWWCLADLKTYAFSADELALLRSHATNGALAAESRIALHYTLGKALQDRGAWAESFDHYTRGAAIKRANLRYDADRTTAETAFAISNLTADFLAPRQTGGAFSDAPIFIVGLPRSGSTLVEQILASHPQVEATLELPYIPHIAAEIARAAGPGGAHAALARLTAAERCGLGEAYLERTRRHRRLGRRHFIDKLPANFTHIGLIRLLLPHAKIIDVRRHPMAACFANFCQLFAYGQDFTYDLTALGRYYRDYVTLMAHFDTVLPGFVHRLIYEDLVESPEVEIRRLLAFCGLKFEPSCLRPWEGGRAVPTHSSEQVRAPINRAGLDAYRHYLVYLSPLRPALGDTLRGWRGSPLRGETP